jgi:hypothetical protein
VVLQYNLPLADFNSSKLSSLHFISGNMHFISDNFFFHFRPLFFRQFFCTSSVSQVKPVNPCSPQGGGSRILSRINILLKIIKSSCQNVKPFLNVDQIKVFNYITAPNLYHKHLIKSLFVFSPFE